MNAIRKSQRKGTWLILVLWWRSFPGNECGVSGRLPRAANVRNSSCRYGTRGPATGRPPRRKPYAASEPRSRSSPRPSAGEITPATKESPTAIGPPCGMLGATRDWLPATATVGTGLAMESSSPKATKRKEGCSPQEAPRRRRPARARDLSRRREHSW